MKLSKLTWILGALTAASLTWGIYSWNRMRYLEKQTENWKAKYEEAIIDAEEAVQRVQAMEQKMAEELAKAESEKTQLREQLQQIKGKAGR